MPSIISQAGIAFKALHQLGPGQVGRYAFYRLALEAGWLEFKTRMDVNHALQNAPEAFVLHPLLNLPDPKNVRSFTGEQALPSLRAEAEEIASGSVRLFGAEPVPLDLSLGSSHLPWTAYTRGRTRYPVEDVKFLWEPARFGWAFTLGRAYLLSGDERYPAAFWQQALHFLAAHPPNLGPHWVSAQEVALRILAFVWAAQAFAGSSHTTPEVLAVLGKAVAACAARIPATLSYSRALNNNHLLSEAIGLLTAGLSLPSHPQSSTWTSTGRKWLNRGLRDQISRDGTYVQHSTSYHRLMLHLALWAYAISGQEMHTYSATVHERLAAATAWLLALLERSGGPVPNLGPNDGAHILPLAACHHDDYRPVLQAASHAFLGGPCLPPDAWDELSLWLGLYSEGQNRLGEIRHQPNATPATGSDPGTLRIPAIASWAYLRAAHFTSRPGHADQLHLDLWWRGLNIAQDAGTYLYNASSPWDNSLTHTAVHNTLTIDDQEQMRRAGRFLYIDWAHAQLTHRGRARDGSWESLTARHDGYRRLGIVHQRTVTAFQAGIWKVEDRLKTPGQVDEQCHRIRLHWLVPDWPWHVADQTEKSCRLDLETPHGVIQIQMEMTEESHASHIEGLQVVRAGEVLHGVKPALPTWGWASPTYGVKVPALSLSLTVETAPPLTLVTRWILPLDTPEE